MGGPECLLHHFRIVGRHSICSLLAFLAHLRHQVMPTILAADFLILGLLLGPILEESVFRGCLLPVVARSFGRAGSTPVPSTNLFAPVVQRTRIVGLHPTDAGSTPERRTIACPEQLSEAK